MPDTPPLPGSKGLSSRGSSALQECPDGHSWRSLVAHCAPQHLQKRRVGEHYSGARPFAPRRPLRGPKDLRTGKLSHLESRPSLVFRDSEMSLQPHPAVDGSFCWSSLSRFTSFCGQL